MLTGLVCSNTLGDSEVHLFCTNFLLLLQKKYLLLAECTKRMGYENKKGKTEDPLTCCTDLANEARMLKSYGFVDYSRKQRKSLDVLTGGQELHVKVHTATYRSEIDQSQYVKSISQPI